MRERKSDEDRPVAAETHRRKQYYFTGSSELFLDGIFNTHAISTTL